MSKTMVNWKTPGLIEKLEALYRSDVSYRNISSELSREFPGIEFTWERVRQKIRSLPCFDESRRLGARRKKITAAAVDAEGQLARMRADLLEMSGVNRALKLRNGELQNIRDLIVKASQPIKPLRRKHGLRRKTRGGHPVNLLIGDWQVGEVIEDEACGGWGRYDFGVAQRRVALLGEKLLSWVEIQRSGFRIESLNVFVVGDMVAGDIHEGLRRTNEFPTPVAACKAGHLLAELVKETSPHFAQVDVHLVGVDNHGRLTVRPQFKKGALNNWNVVVSEMAAADLRLHENVHMNYHVANPAKVRIMDSNVLVMHGAQIKSWMGLPYYGLDRYRGKKAIAHMMRDERIDLMICGHFHTTAQLPGWMMNGCLPGTGELDNAVGRFGPPSQTSFLWNREHGPFNITPWNLQGKGEGK